MSVDINVEAQKLREMYASDDRTESFNAIVYGGMGTGKTSLLATARKPVLLHSFDPGGAKVLDAEVKKGEIIVDSRYEVDDPTNPTAFNKWLEECKRLERIGMFSHLGTYCIDSLTMWATSALNRVLKTAGRAGGTPQQNDWYPQMILIENAVRTLTALPCDFILIGHEDSHKDEVLGKISYKLMVTGKLVARLPAMFDEIYHAEVKDSSKGPEHFLRTRRNGTYDARTRLGRRGIFDELEKPDIKHLLKKAGKSTDDKPLLFGPATVE